MKKVLILDFGGQVDDAKIAASRRIAIAEILSHFHGRGALFSAGCTDFYRRTCHGV